MVSGEKDLTLGTECGEAAGKAPEPDSKVSSLPFFDFCGFQTSCLWSPVTLFMQENKEENAAPPKSVNCN